MSHHAKKKKFAKRPHKKRAHGFLVFLLVVLGFPALALAAFLTTFDINAHRARIETALSEGAGREIKLEGPISFAVSVERGVSVAVSKVTVGNPSWASRPDMARIGKARLHVNLRALLERKIDVIAFDLTDADVQLETNASGAGNWMFGPKGEADEKASAEKQLPSAGKGPVALNIREVRIENSRFGLKGKDGKLTVLDVPSLVFREEGEGLRADFKGSVASVPTEINLVGGKIADLTGKNWPFSLHALYAGAIFDGKGSVRDHLKRIDFESLSLTAGESKLTGQIEADFSGNRPAIRGKLRGDRFDSADLKAKDQSNMGIVGSIVDAATLPAQPKKKSDKIFSREPLPLSGLKTVDVEATVSIGALVLGLTTINAFESKISLENGQLVVSPLSGGVAGSKVDGVVKIDARAPQARVETVFKGNNLDFSKLMDLGGMESLISGKVDLDMDLSSEGRSSYDLAAHANGRLNLLMDAGTISASGLRDFAGGLVDIFLPGARALASPGVNCMAARYVITNGLVDTKGLLIDMDTTTVAGSGTINLPDEHINMYLRTKPKGVGLGAIVPPMKIHGALSEPEFLLDTGSAIHKVAGMLTNNGSVDDSVPTLLAVKGKNACAVTLDNPALAKIKATEDKPPLVSDSGTLTDTVKETVKGMGGKILENIGNGLFGQ